MILKELIERELGQYLEWPTADKSHVTTVSAKLFAEHVARLYADHFRDAAKMVVPAVQGEPVAIPARTTFGGPQRFTTAEQQPSPDVEALVEALEEGLRAIGDHHAPGDCYATGPMTGDPFRDLVQCPACSFIAMCDDLLAAHRKQGGEA